jgi:plasmid maintenance system antidote protein VapI
MKSYKEIEKKYTPKEIAESFVFPNDLNKVQREQSLNSFREWRKGNETNRTTESKLKIQLLQLKFLMEDYIKQVDYKNDYNFSYFLKEYIIRLEKKNKDFAEEIDIDPTELSQIINKHRAPNEKLIIRLEIHSNRNFPAIMWFKLIEKEKVFQLEHDTKLRISENKHVKSRLAFSL